MKKTSLQNDKMLLLITVALSIVLTGMFAVQYLQVKAIWIGVIWEIAVLPVLISQFILFPLAWIRFTRHTYFSKKLMLITLSVTTLSFAATIGCWFIK